jgi:hypothetical protein
MFFCNFKRLKGYRPPVIARYKTPHSVHTEFAPGAAGHQFKEHWKDTVMDNNKNRKKDREKSNPELRRMEPRDNSDVGIVDGKKIGVHGSKHEKN